jgi:hypothetical protein
MEPGLFLALHLVKFTGPDNQTVLINPEAVIELRDPRGRPGEHFHHSVHCLVFTGNGKYTPVTETCVEVRQRLEHLAPSQE